MVRIHVFMQATREPLKRGSVLIRLDTDPERPLTGSTGRDGRAVFEIPPASGKVEVDGIVRYQGRLAGDIDIGVWSPTDGGNVPDRGAPGVGGGSTAYPGMKTRTLAIAGQTVVTDSEGYLVDLDDWSEAFVRVQAAVEELALTDEHWEVIRFLRSHHEQHQVQANVREIIKHFQRVWSRERGSNRYLHDLFPGGGPQKQGNRLAGLLRVKGEH